MKNIDTWNKNVSNYINELNQKLLENEEAVQLYNGFYVWDSKILQNHHIIFHTIFTFYFHLKLINNPIIKI